MQMHLEFINEPNFNKNCENSKFDSNILDVTSTMYLLQKNYEWTKVVEYREVMRNGNGWN